MTLKIYSHKNGFICISNTEIASDFGDSIEKAVNEFLKHTWTWNNNDDNLSDKYWSTFTERTTPIKIINSTNDPEYFI